MSIGLAIPLDGEQRDWSFGAANKFVGDSNYSTDILNRAYDMRDTAATAYKRNPTGENALEYEKRLIAADYISNVNKAIRDMPIEQQRDARGVLLETVRNLDMSLSETEKKIITKFSEESPEGYLVSQLPEIKLEQAKNSVKYEYTMTQVEYDEFLDDYFNELDRRRATVMRATNASPEIIADRLKEAKSEAAKTVREKYKAKFRAKFEKVV